MRLHPAFWAAGRAHAAAQAGHRVRNQKVRVGAFTWEAACICTQLPWAAGVGRV